MERLTERTAIGILVKEDYGKEVLRTLYSCYGGKPNPHYTNCEEGYCAMEKLATYEDAEEQGIPIRWIPCSERLPENGIDVLAFFKDRDCVIAYRTMKRNGHTCWVNSSTGSEIVAEIVAWMPLPKPYRESEGQHGEING